jgi:mono/diheme cytochrome c family protein
MPTLTRFVGVAVLALLAGSLAGCHSDMRDQPRHEAFEASDFFADGQASRSPVTGTVARGQLREDGHFYTGLNADGKFAEELPVPLTRALLERGRERFDIFCSVCHGRTGDGLGMVVRRGFKQPTSFHDQRLRESPVGYVYDVITNGFGAMSSYAAQVKPADRWAIAAYVKALQHSQNVRVEELPRELRDEFQQSLEEAARREAAGDNGPDHGSAH